MVKKEENCQDIPSEYSILHVPYDTLKGEEAFDSYFSRIANFLLNECLIIANKTKFRILEIEFYYTCESHNDPYTHCDSVQYSTGNWYFHKMGSGYKGGLVNKYLIKIQIFVIINIILQKL